MVERQNTPGLHYKNSTHRPQMRGIMHVLALLVLLTFLLQSGGTKGLVQLLFPQAPVSSLDMGQNSRVNRPVVDLSRTPLLFIENQGQADAQVAYTIQGSRKTIYFTDSGLTFALLAPPEPQGLDLLDDAAHAQHDSEQIAYHPASQADTAARWVVKLTFEGANPAVRPLGQQPADTVVSYFRGSPDEWQVGLPVFTRLVYPELWPGIDLAYSGSSSQLKSEFILQPGSDPAHIRLLIHGASQMRLNDGGQLVISTPLGDLVEDAPLAYQEIGGRQVAVQAGYELLEAGAGAGQGYRFRLGDYDPAYPLVIDPVLITFCGYIGGADAEYAEGVAIDSAENMYVVGSTLSSQTSFPETVGPDLTYNGTDGYIGDAFVAKVKADGSGLLYAGYIGGTRDDEGRDIAVDSAGNAYIVGRTRSRPEEGFPLLVGPELTHSGKYDDWDAFVTRINASGTALVYSGYVGGSYYDYGYAIAVDSAGSAYITGVTDSDESSFPVLVGPDLTHNGLTITNYDGFVAKIKPDGSGFIYCGYIGGEAIQESATDIAVDNVNRAYVVGHTFSTETQGFPLKNGPDLTHNGNDDAFITRVKADGSGLDYSGYIGGASDEYGFSVAVDSAYNAYVVGTTWSSQSTFPVLVGPDLTYNGEADVFITRVKADGTGLLYSGYIGGTGNDWGYNLAVNGAGNAYVGGRTTSTQTTFPVLEGPDLTHNGGTDINGYSDVFVASLKANGSGLIYCGYVGGAGEEGPGGVAVDSAGDLYLVGWTDSTQTTFPETVGPDLTYNGGTYDVFVAKIHAVGSLVLVKNDSGNAVPGARVYRNGSYVGTTGADGKLALPDLEVGDRLATRWLARQVAAVKDAHDQDSTQDWAYREYDTSVTVDNLGNFVQHTVTSLDGEQLLTVSPTRRLIGFNLLVSVEWDATAEYLYKLRMGFFAASQYLLDVSDGQMFFERVTIYDDKKNWKHADFRFHASNQQWPEARFDGMNQLLDISYMFLGRYFNGLNSYSGEWVLATGFKTLIHEFGHYGLSLWDSYYYYDDGRKLDASCTSPEVITNTLTASNATIMYLQFYTSELSAKDVPGLWSNNCGFTYQYQKTGKSDWEALEGKFANLRSPIDRGSLVAGPAHAHPTGFPTVDIQDTLIWASCPAPYYVGLSYAGKPAAESDLYSNMYGIYQGKTNEHGVLEILGAMDGDIVAVWPMVCFDDEFGSTCQRLDFIELQIDCLSGMSAADAPSTPSVVEIELQPAPFSLTTRVLPGSLPNQAELWVEASTSLSEPPQASVTQEGALAPGLVTLASAGGNRYSGVFSLDPDLPQNGILQVSAQDLAAQTVKTISQFRLAQLEASAEAWIWSVDGMAELYVPLGSLAGDGQVSLAPVAPPDVIPEGFVLLGSPYELQFSPGLSLLSSLVLDLAFPDSYWDLIHVDMATVQMYYWNTGLEQWQALDGVYLDAGRKTTAPVTQPGIYAVMAVYRDDLPVYLPLIRY